MRSVASVAKCETGDSFNRRGRETDLLLMTRQAIRSSCSSRFSRKLAWNPRHDVHAAASHRTANVRGSSMTRWAISSASPEAGSGITRTSRHAVVTHGRRKWETFYSSEVRELQRRFFDHFLKGEDNGWERTPCLRLAIVESGPGPSGRCSLWTRASFLGLLARLGRPRRLLGP